MEQIKAFANRRPLVFSIAILAISLALTELPAQLLFEPFMDHQSAFYLGVTLLQVLTGLFLMLLLIRLDLFKNAGFGAPQSWRSLWLLWPLAVMTLLNGSDFLTGALVVDWNRPVHLILLVLINLSVGFFEEVLGRGVVLLVLLNKWGSTRKGIYAAVLLSSALFGLAHLVNLLASRKDLVSNLAQIGYASFFAVIFAACFLRIKSIYPVMLLHAAFDFASGLSEVAVGGGLREVADTLAPDAAILIILITLPLMLYGLFILRKVKPAGELPENPGLHDLLGRQPHQLPG